MKKGYSREVAENTVRKAHHCHDISKTPIYMIDDIEFYTCPCNFKHPFFNFLLISSSNKEKGILPFPGSLSEQPAQSMEAIQLLELLVLDYKDELMKKESNKNVNGQH